MRCPSTMPECRMALRESLCDLRDLIERFAAAAVAFLVTAGLGSLMHLEHGAYEVGLLNAGLAYYTHEASHRVIKAIYRLWQVAPLPTTSRRGPRDA